MYVLPSGDYLAECFVLKDGKEVVHLESYGALINLDKL
jgi:hypothetical protein